MTKRKMKIRKNDQVFVITGKDKGKMGRVLRVYSETDRVLVEKINMVKKHTKPSAKNRQGGIVEKEASIHVSNVMLVDPKLAVPTRISWKITKEGEKVRLSKKSGEVLDSVKA